MSAFSVNRVVHGLLTASLLFGSTVAGAATPQAVPTISPWAALSIFGTQSSQAAVCGASTAAATTAQGDRPGCVLPAVDPPAVPPTANVGAAPPVYLPAAGDVGLPPLLLALAAIAAGAFLLAMDDDEDEAQPVSPS